MGNPENLPLVQTIKEHCRVCYTCVRECPAKAIRIADGQAEVLTQRCVGCGNCVRVCSQNAKQVLDETGDVWQLLAGPETVAAIVAPSFPAEFTDIDDPVLVGMLASMGFDYVNEVAFGADLVASAYAKLVKDAERYDRRYIATTCPAIVGYVERYHPELVDSLAPIVSPMVAAVRALRSLHGDDLKVVFIGPCIAKKGEAPSSEARGETDAALTFTELRRMFDEAGIEPDPGKGREFDDPQAGAGALFSISRGLLQAASVTEDLITGDVVAAEGRSNFTEAIKEFSSGDLDARLLEVLCCKGCIMGAGMTSDAPLFSRRSRVSAYVRERIRRTFDSGWRSAADRFPDLDLTRSFRDNDQRIPVPFEQEIRQIMAKMGKREPADELNCGACGYESCRDHAIAIFKGLAESEMCLPNTIEQLRMKMLELATSNEKLASTQEQLMHSERLASMGQLAAGIAHEVNNPLGVVLMYAHLLLDEAKDKGLDGEDLRMIAEQADRCKKIVSGLLNFARQNKVLLEPVDVRELVDRTVKAVTKPAGVRLATRHEIENPTADLDGDQIVQALTNLVSNGYAAMGESGTLTVETHGDAERVQFVIRDTGTGISRENLGKIFEPFFTTKQIGKGTGLGLAVTYGVVKMHQGDIQVESNDDASQGPTGTSFTISLPRHPKTPDSAPMQADEQQAGLLG
jgi:signal transduction histidine kinase/Fe-S-cluster-containing hydrogenase component 2